MQLKDVETLEITYSYGCKWGYHGVTYGLDGNQPGWGEIATLPSFIVCWIAEESRADVYSGDQH